MKTEICIPITAKTVEKAIEDLKEAEKIVDLVELRIDYIKNIDNEKLEKLIQSKKNKIIVTCRSKSLGSNFKGNEKERIDLLKKAVELDADLIDIELESGNGTIKGLIKNKNKTRIIVSHHNSKETPKLEELNDKYSEIKKLNPDIVKIVTNAKSVNDNFKIFRLLKGKNDLIAFCMELRGHISRILAPKYGSLVTFASSGNEKESAPGQITIDEMKNVYNIDSIDKDTKVVGIIGEFAEDSMSKYMHNPSFKEEKLNYVYVPFKVEKEELKEFIKNMREFNFRGSSVTIPHKVEVMKYIDEVDDTAEKVGAVNTLVENDGKLNGYNTDYYGAVQALKEKTPLKEKEVFVIGTGGAGRAVVYGLKKENAEVTVTDINAGKAKLLAKEFDVKFENIEKMEELVKKNEIIINATSVGMTPNINESIIKEKDLVKGTLIMDVVYNPVNTKFVQHAKNAGCKTVTGDRMLIHQAIGQFKLWTGKEPDFKLMESALLKHVNR
jgi:3-dehydroquinate dehydratase/shikimate dehydrogenase|tara:strand:- start:5079 stop:6569 length:1491 start_codon:yes stop_codon:yes gene_type:complete